MRFAVCDDEKQDLEIIIRALCEYGVDRLDIEGFFDARSLLLCHAKSPFDIIILDIEMPEINGYEAAKELSSTRPKPVIMFLTRSMAYATKGYGIAFRYLTKPIDAAEFAASMDAAICEVRSNRFPVTVGSTSHIFAFDDIYYIESLSHYMVIHTAEGEFSFRSSLKEIMPQLPAGYFGAPHMGYLVNLSHIRTVTADLVHLDNGERIPLSRRFKKEFNGQLFAYLGR